MIYRTADEDSFRWDGFPFRDGDIVISTRSKHGTTWVQMICALLIFRRPDLPTRLGAISPWLDWVGEPRDEVIAQLEAQQHRRIVKTHTPLDGIPLDRRAHYIVVARDPLDAAVSLYHQSADLRRDVAREPLPPIATWLRAWIDFGGAPEAHLDSLPGVMLHLRDAWDRRDDPKVSLVRYSDLAADLDGSMRSLATTLAIGIDEPSWPSLVQAATFESMRAEAEHLAPPPDGVLVDRSAFFRRGRLGEAAEIVGEEGVRRYRERVAELAPPELLDWLHEPRTPTPI
jgi:aryl sulfotransferase